MLDYVFYSLLTTIFLLHVGTILRVCSSINALGTVRMVTYNIASYSATAVIYLYLPTITFTLCISAWIWSAYFLYRAPFTINDMMRIDLKRFM